MTLAADPVILRWLARRGSATASAVAAACAMSPDEVRAGLPSLEGRRLISARQGLGMRAPRRIYTVTGEGRRAARSGDVRKGV